MSFDICLLWFVICHLLFTIQLMLSWPARHSSASINSTSILYWSARVLHLAGFNYWSTLVLHSAAHHSSFVSLSNIPCTVFPPTKDPSTGTILASFSLLLAQLVFHQQYYYFRHLATGNMLSLPACHMSRFINSIKDPSIGNNTKLVSCIKDPSIPRYLSERVQANSVALYAAK